MSIKAGVLNLKSARFGRASEVGCAQSIKPRNSGKVYRIF
jgi:hypothetical protein